MAAYERDSQYYTNAVLRASGGWCDYAYWQAKGWPRDGFEYLVNEFNAQARWSGWDSVTWIIDITGAGVVICAPWDRDGSLEYIRDQALASLSHSICTGTLPMHQGGNILSVC
jgi:hypothetical protein